MADRTWQPDGPHRMTLRMGPVEVDVKRNSWSNEDNWVFAARVLLTGEGWFRLLRDKYRDSEIEHSNRGAPLAQCQADAIAAVEAWRDSIR